MRFSELDGARIGVWGAGREIGSFAAQLARRLPNARIAVIALDGESGQGLPLAQELWPAQDFPPAQDLPPTRDLSPAQDLSPTRDLPHALSAAGARVVTGADIGVALSSCDVIVRSPGVSIYRHELRALRAAGKPVTTATALWLAEREGRAVIGVSGTKGKSTTAALLAHLVRASGRAAELAGNIGRPALDLLERPANELAIIELSSYQIADLQTGPETALITNLFREHTDWHGSERAYRTDKLRLLSLAGVRTAVINARDDRLVEAVGANVATVLYGNAQGWDAGPRGITLRGELVLPAERLPLRGEHNTLNLCAALASLSAHDIEPPPLADALSDFQALPHRLQLVVERDRVMWVDDSISTTPESTLAALMSFGGHEVVLLGGGQDRGQDYDELAVALAERSAAVIGLPSTGPRLVRAARRAGVPAARALNAGGMEQAVAQARALARPGAVVLLSPAAPSYDSYRNFEARGAHFRALAIRR